MKTITIINQYSGNKGDRAVCYFLLTELCRYGYEIILSTNNKKNWENEPIIKENNIKLVTWGWNVDNFNPKNRLHWEKRRFFRIVGLPYLLNRINRNKKGLGLSRLFINSDFYKALLNSDLIISTGGHHLTTRFTPELHNELLFDLASTTLSGKKYILWSQTFGPFEFNVERNKKAVINILNSAEKIYYRDIYSLHELKQLQISNEKLIKTYETVIGLNSHIKEYTLPQERENVVGITIYNAEKRTAEEYLQYCKTMAEISDWLISNGFKIKFFPHEIKGAVIDDRKCINDVVLHIDRKSEVLIENNDLTTLEHLSDIMKCKVFIGHKTHSVIFALTVGTPLIAISYHFKTKDFLKEYGLDQNVIDEEKLSLENFIPVFESLLKNADLIGKKQLSKSEEFSKIICKDLENALLS